jgi:hypothetical protein
MTTEKSIATRKLALNTETVRNLQDSDLKQVAGGVARTTEYLPITGDSACECASLVAPPAGN